MYGDTVASNGTRIIPKFVKIGQPFQKMKKGQTHKQHYDLVSLLLALKKEVGFCMENTL
jgi:hypothetical protein